MPHNITFHDKDGNTIGEFNFDKLPCTFKGNVDESAKMFVDVVSQFITQRLQPSPEAREEFKISSCGESFTLSKGMTKGKVWIGKQDGEGGDFDQDELFVHIRRFYDERF